MTRKACIAMGDHVGVHIAIYRSGKQRDHRCTYVGKQIQEIREAYRRLGMHTRLGKVKRLKNLHEPCRKITGYQGSSYSVKLFLNFFSRGP